MTIKTISFVSSMTFVLSFVLVFSTSSIALATHDKENPACHSSATKCHLRLGATRDECTVLGEQCVPISSSNVDGIGICVDKSLPGFVPGTKRRCPIPDACFGEKACADGIPMDGFPGGKPKYNFCFPGKLEHQCDTEKRIYHARCPSGPDRGKEYSYEVDLRTEEPSVKAEEARIKNCRPTPPPPQCQTTYKWKCGGFKGGVDPVLCLKSVRPLYCSPKTLLCIAETRCRVSRASSGAVAGSRGSFGLFGQNGAGESPCDFDGGSGSGSGNGGGGGGGGGIISATKQCELNNKNARGCSQYPYLCKFREDCRAKGMCEKVHQVDVKGITCSEVYCAEKGSDGVCALN